MTLLDRLLPHLAQVLVVVTGLIILALFLAVVCGKQGAAARHGILLCALVGTFLSPLVIVLAELAGLELATFPFSLTGRRPAQTDLTLRPDRSSATPSLSDTRSAGITHGDPRSASRYTVEPEAHSLRFSRHRTRNDPSPPERSVLRMRTDWLRSFGCSASSGYWAHSVSSFAWSAVCWCLRLFVAPPEGLTKTNSPSHSRSFAIVWPSAARRHWQSHHACPVPWRSESPGRSSCCRRG